MTLALPKNLFGKLRENLNEFGFRETVERSGQWLANRWLTSIVHRHSRPPLSAFDEAAASMHFSAADFARTYVSTKTGETELARLRSEYDVLRAEINRRYGELSGAYPQRYAVEEGSAFLLYTLVRSRRPSVVLETGVANGHSSFFILSALRTNNHGVLHSVDRSADVGAFLSSRERERWYLHVLEARNLKASFSSILEALAPLDMFFHDSDHSYPWQAFEFEAALRKLAPDAILASDDCDSSYAFVDFCKSVGVRPCILVDTRKIFGVIFMKLPAEKRPDSTDGKGSGAQEPRLLARV